MNCVWLVLAFGTTKLISVKALNSDGCAVMFQDNTATCFKDRIVLFIALAISNGLFILEDNTAFNAMDYKDHNQLDESTAKL